MRKPQAILDEIVGAVSFDPIRFADLSAAMQRARLLGAANPLCDEDSILAARGGKADDEDLPVSPGATLAELDTAISVAFDLRRVRGRELETLKIEHAALATPGIATFPDFLRDMREIISRKDESTKRQREIESTKRLISDSQILEEAMRQRIVELQTELSNTQLKLETSTAETARVKKILAKLPAPEDRDDDKELAEIEEHNRKAHAREQWQHLGDKLADKSKEHDRLDATLAKLRDLKRRVEMKAVPAIEGLEITEDGLTWFGKPLSQASTAERMMVGVRVAMQLNPRLHVLRIQDGQSLDRDSMAMLSRLAAENDFQVWIERVADEPSGHGFWIEAGRVDLPAK
jgi:hypothetical protein